MFLLLMTFMGFGNGTLVFMLSLSWCEVVLGSAVITSPPWRLASPRGPMWVEANNYSLRVMTEILDRLTGGLSHLKKILSLCF